MACRLRPAKYFDYALSALRCLWSIGLSVTVGRCTELRQPFTSMASNYHILDSPEQLQSILSVDLTKLSVLYFRAEWAEVCKTQCDGKLRCGTESLCGSQSVKNARDTDAGTRA